jgi:hypothetical protein
MIHINPQNISRSRQGANWQFSAAETHLLVQLRYGQEALKQRRPR